MRKLMISALCLVSLTASMTASAQPSNVALLNKSFKFMQPISVKQSNSDIFIVLDAPSITTEIYDAAIFNVCQPVWLKKSDIFLKKIKSVFILNKTSFSGYVFDDPLAACKKAGDEQPDQSKVTILSNTRLFINKGNK